MAMQRRVGAMATAWVFALGAAGCNPAKETASAGEGASSGAGGGATADYSQYNTLKGTFTAPGVNATFTGAVQGNTQGLSGAPQTGWHLTDGFAANPNGIPQSPKLTGTWPGGGTGTVQALLVKLPGAAAAGKFTCSGGAGEPNVSVFLKASDGTSTVYDAKPGTCEFVFQSPTKVAVKTAMGETEYLFAHGSLKATLAKLDRGSAGPVDATLSATW